MTEKVIDELVDIQRYLEDMDIDEAILYSDYEILWNRLGDIINFLYKGDK